VAEAGWIGAGKGKAVAEVVKIAAKLIKIARKWIKSAAEQVKIAANLASSRAA
jgi:hypothetical protein